MAIVASDTGTGGDFKQVPQGTHAAICNMVVDLGKQRAGFNGEEKIQHKVYIRWELPNERMNWTDREGREHDAPMSIGRAYTLSLHEKAALRGDLEAWRGRSFTKEELVGFDVAKLLGVPCMLVVTHKESNGKLFEAPAGKTPPAVSAPSRGGQGGKSEDFGSLPPAVKQSCDGMAEAAYMRFGKNGDKAKYMAEYRDRFAKTYYSDKAA